MLQLANPAGLQRIVLQAAVPPSPENPDGESEAFVVMAPITAAMRRRALRATRRFLTESEIESTQDLSADQAGDLGEFVAKELIRLGMVEWGGIGDADKNALDLTPDRDTRFATANEKDRPTGTIDLLLNDEDVVNKIDGLYVLPDALRRAEKNGLSGSRSGTGTGATPAKTTARLAARPRRKAAAKNARTAKTSSKRKPAKASGKS